MARKNKLTGYAYMNLGAYEDLSNQVVESHSKTVKRIVEPNLREMQMRKERGARKISKLLLD